MKEKLKNSLQLLSDAVDELEQNFSLYKDFKSRKYEEELDFYKMKEEKVQAQIDNLGHSLAMEQDKVKRAVNGIKDLSITLKNKLNNF